MYSFISPTGETVKTKTIKQFADQYGFRYSNARSLACGHYQRLKGWCSTSSTAKKARERFQTVLVNPNLGVRDVLGQNFTDFAKKHHLAVNDVYQLVNARLICYRGWMLEKTLKLAHSAIPVGSL